MEWKEVNNLGGLSGILDGLSAFRQDQLKPRLATAIGGGQVRQGPFTFYLFLYADDTIRTPQQASDPAHASDIPGVGWSGVWVYHGPGINSQVAEAWGTLPDSFQEVALSNQLHDGDSGGHDGGGIILPQGSRPGDRVQIALKLSSSEGTYGATIAFTLATHGVENVSVSPLN